MCLYRTHLDFCTSRGSALGESKTEPIPFGSSRGAWLGLSLVLVVVASACAPKVTHRSPSSQRAPEAPWSASRLPRSAVPAVFHDQWRRAENRASCALLAPVALGEGVGAAPRAAAFSGGWAVAYDRPGQRSLFGIAGTGSTPDGTTYDDWPHRVRWADGSAAGYGPEGGSGPNQLAYLVVAGQRCLYNVWSRLGVAHLEYLLSQLRFVE